MASEGQLRFWGLPLLSFFLISVRISANSFLGLVRDDVKLESRPRHSFVPNTHTLRSPRHVRLACCLSSPRIRVRARSGVPSGSLEERSELSGVYVGFAFPQVACDRRPLSGRPGCCVACVPPSLPAQARILVPHAMRLGDLIIDLRRRLCRIGCPLALPADAFEVQRHGRLERRVVCGGVLAVVQLPGAGAVLRRRGSTPIRRARARRRRRAIRSAPAPPVGHRRSWRGLRVSMR